MPFSVLETQEPLSVHVTQLKCGKDNLSKYST